MRQTSHRSVLQTSWASAITVTVSAMPLACARVKPIRRAAGGISAFAFSPDSKNLAGIAGDSNVTLPNVSSGAEDVVTAGDGLGVPYSLLMKARSFDTISRGASARPEN